MSIASPRRFRQRMAEFAALGVLTAVPVVFAMSPAYAVDPPGPPMPTTSTPTPTPTPTSTPPIPTPDPTPFPPVPTSPYDPSCVYQEANATCMLNPNDPLSPQYFNPVTPDDPGCVFHPGNIVCMRPKQHPANPPGPGDDRPPTGSF